MCNKHDQDTLIEQSPKDMALLMQSHNAITLVISAPLQHLLVPDDASNSRFII